MTTYVALLRGINVGGRSKLAMADLRRVVEGTGAREVKTYINSGNVVLTSDERDGAVVAAAIEEALAAEVGRTVPVLVLSADELEDAAAHNPFPDETDPKKVHLVFLWEAVDAAGREAAAAAQEQAAAKGSRDRVEVRGAVAYLHTPDGLGRSVLADLLGRRADPTATGTTRNWSTVTRLRALCAEREGWPTPGGEGTEGASR